MSTKKQNFIEKNIKKFLMDGMWSSFELQLKIFDNYLQSKLLTNFFHALFITQQVS